MKTLDAPILALGGGNMAHAILAGAIQAQQLTDGQVAVIDPNEERRSLFANAFQGPGDASAWLASQPDHRPLVLLAVKPQMLREALPPLIEAMQVAQVRPCTFVSILAGSRIETIGSMLREGDRVIRVMTNTPAQIGQGMTAIANDNQPDPDDLCQVRALFEAVGEVIVIPESLLDAFTAVAGSGPAYLFYLAEGMMRAAESIGFTAEQASTIVRQTLLGSSGLLARSMDTPGELRSKVTSKNGTTYAATTTLDDHKVMDAIVAALTAARDRGVELASEA
ncbi:MAG: pyrroline-5-carboxylate reductase [Phycisphaerales bacterium]|nr:pyrroline-5-carboxylate reductase [Phycisphaerales bacterium]